MNVSPLDLRQQRFRSAFRGFNKIEVTSFLAAVADDYEQALRESDRLRQDLARLEAVLSEHREHEKTLQSTMMTAQKLSDDIKANAELEARRIIRDAESRSDLLLEKTQSRLEDIQREIDGLKLKRRDVETSIESTIQTLRNTLEYVHEQEAREREDKILLHRPRQAEPAPQAEQRDAHEARRYQGLPGPPFGLAFCIETPDGVVLAVRVIPRAKKHEIAGTREGALLVRLAAPPVEGAANDALIALLADRLGVPRRAVRIVSGERGRQKRVAVSGVTADHVLSRL